jgi:hypothetical protein
MRFVGIMQGCKNPGDNVFVQGLLSLSLSLSLSICVIIRKCSLQYFGKHNFKKLYHIFKILLGTIRMGSEMEDL